jgi:hypothetical protein
MKGAIEKPMTAKYCLNLDTVTNNKINKKYYYTTLSTYVILTYNKNYITFDDVNTGLYRSIVFSYPTKKVVCFSPPKSINSNIFMKKYPMINDNIYINEAMEGVTINLFYDNNIRQWMISTKNSIGGKYWFYGKTKDNIRKLTFLDLFIHVLNGEPKQEVNDLALLEYFPKNYCYNFVLQHETNNIVLPVKENNLYLIGVYKINENEVEYIPQKEYQSWELFRNLDGIIRFPKQYTASDYKELENTSESLIRGYMVTNMETGERTKIANKQYEDLKLILKIKPEIQYQFLCLYRIGKERIEEYLKYFPKMKKEYYYMLYLLEQFMKNVHNAYLSRYVYKDGIPILEKYQSHIYKIHHEVYLPLINKNIKAKIKYKTVVEYFTKMEPRELLYILNWDARMDNL